MWVGTMDSEKLEFMGFIELDRGLVVTGSRVSAITERSSGYAKESMFRASRGPKTSSAWNPGKTTIP